MPTCVSRFSLTSDRPARSVKQPDERCGPVGERAAAAGGQLGGRTRRRTSRLRTGVALALLLGTLGAVEAPVALAQDVPAFNPDAVAASDGQACLGQLVAFAVRPHEGYTGHGLAGDAPGHGFESVAGLMNGLLRPLCADATEAAGQPVAPESD